MNMREDMRLSSTQIQPFSSLRTLWESFSLIFCLNELIFLVDLSQKTSHAYSWPQPSKTGIFGQYYFL